MAGVGDNSGGAALVGRAREQSALRAALDAAVAGRGSLVLIGGEAGIGKTALAEALLAEARAQGALVLVGRCYDLSETPPYGPWAEALARAPHGDRVPAPPDLAGGGAGSQAALFAAVRDHLIALATTRPLVLLLDDLQWADPASLDLLRTLARGLADLPLLVLGTYRSDELTRRHPLYALLPLLEREARAARLDLRPLDADGVRALVAGHAALPPADRDRLVAWLAGRAEGNAFFTAQLLRALADAGILRRADGGWALGDLGAVGLPTPLRQVLDARLARLGADSLRLLALAAVIGQDVPLALWAAAAETDEEGLLDTVDAAGEALLVTVAPDGDAVRFAHALIRETLYAGLVATRRRWAHRRVAEALLATPGPDPDAVAYHLQRAGDARAAAWLERAGERARRAYAWATAEDRFARALALIDGGAADDDRRGRLLFRLAGLRRYAAPAQAIAHWEELARLAAAGGDRALVAAARCALGLDRILLRETHRGLAELAAGAAALRTLTPEEQAHLDRYAGHRTPWPDAYGTLVAALAYVGRFAEALAAAGPVGRDAPPTAATGQFGASSRADLHLGLGLARAGLGQPAEARRAFADARAAYRGVEHHLFVGWAAAWELLLAALPYRADDLAARRHLAGEAEAALGRARGVPLAAGFAPRLATLPLLLVEGAWAEARALARDAPAARDIPWGEFAPALLGALARAQGDAAGAWARVAEVLPAGPATEPEWQPFPCVQLARRTAAALALDAGDFVLAEAWLRAHDRGLAATGAVLGRAEGQVGWAAYHRAAADLPASRASAEAALAHATAPRQPLALLAARRQLGELDTTAGQHTAAQAHLAAALALAAACAAPYERALTLLALAELHDADADRDGATTALDAARVLLAPLDARPALARAAALATRLAVPTPATPVLPFGLSAREAEVLRLVAEGLTNAQAAERLYLSPKTVSRHLDNIYAKLGVATRTAAARLARERGLA